MKIFELNEQNGRLICWVLVLVDIFLGGSAVFFPYFYAELLHPGLTNPPIDFIIRTGILWLFFMVVQLRAATSKDPKKWFFAVAILRIMDIPADIAYGILALGATTMSQLMILSAPVINTLCGIYLYRLSEKMGI